MPTHCLEPFPNENKYLSRNLALAGSTQRVGSNISELGNRSSLWCIVQELMLTTVWIVVSDGSIFLVVGYHTPPGT